MTETPIKVFLIEDNLQDAEIIMRMLERAGNPGFTVAHAQRLSEGRARLKNEDFDVLLLDLGLPDSRGIETLYRIKEDSPDLPVIVLTGLDDEDFAVKAIHEGADDYLMKGQINAMLLVRTVRYTVERRRAEKREEENQVRLAAIVETSDDVIFSKSLDGIIETWNKGAERVYGYLPSETVGHHVRMLVPPGYPDDIPDIMGKIKRGERVENYETRRMRKDGKRLIVSLTVSPLKDSRGRLIGASTIGRDITKQRQEERELMRWGEIFKNIRIGVVVGSAAEATFEMVNPAFAEMHGYEIDELIGRPIADVFAPETKADVPHMIRIADEKGYYTHETLNIRKDGSIFPVQVDINVVKDGQGELQYRIFNTRDLTEQKKAEETIKYQAYHDLPTGLPNRAQFMMKLGLELNQSKRNQKKIAILHIDLDRFRAINESLGHGVGDKVILAVAERLQGLVRKSDTLARSGSDEFIILLADLKRPEDVASFAELTVDAMRKPLRVNGHELYSTVSIGISMYPEDSTDVEVLLKNADVAVSHVKELGRNGYQFFNPALNRRTVERLILESDLRQTIERNELILYYQPEVSIQTGKIVSVEALVRWNHASHGILAPSEFIPAAEEIGFIPWIDEWALRAACLQSKAWQEAGHPRRVAVNLSAQQFLNPHLLDLVQTILTETGLEPKYVDIEISESTAMRDVELAVPNLKALQQIGVVLSIDDFGTGFSSLSYLKRFPVHKLKIDQSFIRGVAKDADDQAIVKAVIAMAHSLKLRVIAEGVETEEQLAFLRREGCDEMQGFLYSRPVGPEQIEELLAA